MCLISSYLSLDFGKGGCNDGYDDDDDDDGALNVPVSLYLLLVVRRAI